MTRLPDDDDDLSCETADVAVRDRRDGIRIIDLDPLDDATALADLVLPTLADWLTRETPDAA